MAAGVTIRREFIDEFRRTLNAYAAAHFPEMPAPVVHLDARLNPAVVSPDIPRQLQALEPFGAGNPAPLFGLFGMKIRELSPMGGGRHLKLSVQKKGASVVCKCFGTAPEDFPFSVGDTVDLAVQAELNEWHGREELNFIVREVRLSGLSDEECIHSCRVYEKFRRGEALTPAEAETLTPDRRELAAVYRLLRDMGGRWCSHQSLLGRLGEPGAQLGKLAVRLDILEERGLVEFTLRRELLQARVPKQEGKVDIFASSVLERLRAQTARNGPAETGRS